MNTHFHFMIYADNRSLDLKRQGGLILDPITNGFRKLLSTYAHEFNVKNNRSGSLFRPKTKSICLNDEAELNNNHGIKPDKSLKFSWKDSWSDEVVRPGAKTDFMHVN